MKILVLAAHPDDETIGAGGTMARLAAEGHEVSLWIATEVYEPTWPAHEKPARRAEAEKAAAALGVKSVRFGELPTMNLSSMPSIDLANIVSRAIKEHGPEVLIAPPSQDINSDHSAVFDAALVGARGLPGNAIRAFYAYEIGTTTRFAAPGKFFVPDTYVDVTDTFAKKLEAFKCYASEMRDFPHPRSAEGLEIVARERGLACGARYAEGFVTVSRRYAKTEKLCL